MLSNCINKISFSLFFICIAFISNAQDIKWVVKPVIKDVDQVTIPRSSVKQEPLKLLTIKKDGKYGLVDMKGEVILPAEFKNVEVWNGGKHASSYENKIQKFYDNEGYEIEKEEVTDADSKRQRKDKEIKMNGLIEEFVSVSPKLNIVKEGYKYIVLNSETGDTLVPRWSTKTKITAKGIIFYQGGGPDNNHIAVDLNGKVLQKFGKYASIYFQDESHIVVKDGKLYGLYDTNFKEFLPAEYQRLNKIGDDKFVFEKEDKCFIGDSHAKPLYDVKADYIYQSDDKKILVGQDKRVTYLYDSITDGFKTFDFGLASIYKNKTKYRVTNTDTLKGYFDLMTGELIVPLQYRYASISDGLFIGTNSRINKKKRFSVNGQRVMKDVYNSSGKMILSDTIMNLSKIANNYYQYSTTSGIKKVIDSEGNPLFEMEKGIRLSSKHGRFVGISKKGERGTKYYKLSDFISGKRESAFTSIGDIFSYKGSEMKCIVVGRDGAYGIADLEGNIIVPIVFEQIEEVSGYKQYMVVKKDGGFGVIWNPAAI